MLEAWFLLDWPAGLIWVGLVGRLLLSAERVSLIELEGGGRPRDPRWTTGYRGPRIGRANGATYLRDLACGIPSCFFLPRRCVADMVVVLPGPARLQASRSLSVKAFQEPRRPRLEAPCSAPRYDAGETTVSGSFIWLRGGRKRIIDQPDRESWSRPRRRGRRTPRRSPWER